MEECLALLNADITSRRGSVYGFRLMPCDRNAAGGSAVRTLPLDRASDIDLLKFSGDIVMCVETMT